MGNVLGQPADSDKDDPAVSKKSHLQDNKGKSNPPGISAAASSSSLAAIPSQPLPPIPAPAPTHGATQAVPEDERPTFSSPTPTRAAPEAPTVLPDTVPTLANLSQKGISATVGFGDTSVSLQDLTQDPTIGLQHTSTGEGPLNTSLPVSPIQTPGDISVTSGGSPIPSISASNPVPDSSSRKGKIIAIAVAVPLLVVFLVGLFVWRKWNRRRKRARELVEVAYPYGSIIEQGDFGTNQSVISEDTVGWGARYTGSDLQPKRRELESVHVGTNSFSTINTHSEPGEISGQRAVTSLATRSSPRFESSSPQEAPGWHPAEAKDTNESPPGPRTSLITRIFRNQGRRQEHQQSGGGSTVPDMGGELAELRDKVARLESALTRGYPRDTSGDVDSVRAGYGSDQPPDYASQEVILISEKHS